METQGCRYVISVLAPDQVGILESITTAVTDMGANIDGISQTVVEGYFTVILTATFGETQDHEKIKQCIVGKFRKGQASVMVRNLMSSKMRSSRPGRCCRNKTGVPSFRRTSAPTAIPTGAHTTKAGIARPRSNARFPTRR